MYKLKLYKSLLNTDTEDKPNSEHPSISSDISHFYMVLELPFVPFIGLSINMPLNGGHYRSPTISNLTWDEIENSFIFYVDNVMSNNEEAGCTYHQLINNALANGWLLEESIQ